MLQRACNIKIKIYTQIRIYILFYIIYSDRWEIFVVLKGYFQSLYEFILFTATGETFVVLKMFFSEFIRIYILWFSNIRRWPGWTVWTYWGRERKYKYKKDSVCCWLYEGIQWMVQCVHANSHIFILLTGNNSDHWEIFVVLKCYFQSF